MDIFPAKLRELWSFLELRFLVLLSLFLQLILIATGNRRKYTTRKCVLIIVWLSYLSADAVATLALGVLSQQDPKSNPKYSLMSLWAPFLLMHLGGPDTITAYALADNELWSRHLLTLAGQVSVSIYILLMSFVGSPVNYIWIVIFLAGIVKYGERSFVLFLASRDQFRESLVSGPDPGPNYAKFMDEWVSREAEGYIVHPGPAVHSVSISSSSLSLSSSSLTNDHHELVEILQKAFYFYDTFKRLFADLILSFQDKETSYSYFNALSWENAFLIIEVELGLVYDLFYTKAFVLDTLLGFILRVFTVSSTVLVLVAFFGIDKSAYRETEVLITYSLLLGAIILEVYAVVIISASDRMMIRLTGDWPGMLTSIGLSKHKGRIVSCVRKFVSTLRYLHLVPARTRWSDAMGQYNLMNRCLGSNKTISCTKIHQYLDKYLFWSSVSIPNGLKPLIFDNIKGRVDSGEPSKKLGSYRGDRILLKKMDCYDKSDEVEFDQSLLLWHIATDFCFVRDEPGLHDNSNLKIKREVSRRLSDYMMHLLMMSPFMLPSGIGQIRFQDTCAEANEFLEELEGLSKKDALEKLLGVDTRIPPSEVKGDRSKSLLFDACRLVKALGKLEVVRRWEVITEAWLDMLTFAAAQCRWNDHAEKLGQGGELLTHVWLLMAHFGMTDQFQISQGYVRAKLQLE